MQSSTGNNPGCPQRDSNPCCLRQECNGISRLNNRRESKNFPTRVPRSLAQRWPDHRHKTALSSRTQREILKTIPEERCGIFLCLATMGLRNGEARALNIRDYADGELMIRSAVKGPRRDAPTRSPKNGRWRKLPVPPELADWIVRNVPAANGLESRPLFVHPGTGKRWAPTAMRREWHDACERAGVPHVKLYEGARHSAATAWKRQGADDRTIQAILGHTDGRSVERYARLADQAVVEVLRPKRAAE
jgi:integrase